MTFYYLIDKTYCFNTIISIRKQTIFGVSLTNCSRNITVQITKCLQISFRMTCGCTAFLCCALRQQCRTAFIDMLGIVFID